MTDSEHHSFNTLYAAEFGVIGAILIAHFQYWIRFNRRTKRNLIDGKCWTYQTREEIASHFPYLSPDQIKRETEKLEKAGVLILSNYNKKAFDRTLWYAFADEKRFGVDDEHDEKLKKCLRKAESPNRQAKSPNGSGEIARPIPDTKTNTKKEDVDKHSYISKVETPKPSKKSSTSSADASKLLEYFIKKLKEWKPDYVLKNKTSWLNEIDRMLRIDKRDPKKAIQLIDWLASSQKGFRYINCALSFRKQFDAQEMRMDGDKTDDRIKRNRLFAISMKTKYPTQYQHLVFQGIEIGNAQMQKAITCDQPYEQFVQALYNLFGVRNG